ncbi:MAG: DUF433 domain-containing protein [Chloroflexota bacterium]
MTRYALNLPIDLKREAEEVAKKQGISLNQFIMWSVSEKVATMRSQLDDPRFPLITYRRGGFGDWSPVIRGTAIHVKAIASWVKFGETPESVAKNYDLDIKQVQEAQAFYEAHKAEIDADLQEEEDLEEQHKKETKKSRARKNVKAKTSSR